MIQPKPKITGTNILAVLVAGLGSFMFGYSNNIIAGSLAQTSFIEKFLSGENADSVTNGILGGQVANYHSSLENINRCVGSLPVVLLAQWLTPQFPRNMAAR
jgi:hypothetical protein